MIQKRCVICGAGFESQRPNSAYCGNACRCKAYRARKRADKGVHSRILTRDEMDDVRTIATLSFEAADVVPKIATVAGAEIARLVLDGYWALLVALNVDLVALQKSA